MRDKVYFVSDVHLGLQVGDPAEREERFLAFLRSLRSEDTKALYLLGDIWDFWYEYRDVVPKCGFRVLKELTTLIESGVEVFFFEGNHDLWTFSFFESIGIKKLDQPAFVEIGEKTFCLGHGDILGGAPAGYRFIYKIFHSKTLQALFSSLHPWLAYRLGNAWSKRNRGSHKGYRFRGEEEYIYKFALDTLASRKVDYFIFGHFHESVRMNLPGGAEFHILKDWMEGGNPHLTFDCSLSGTTVL